MPLDPLVKAFLDQLAATPGPKTWELTPDQARETFNALMEFAAAKDVPIGKVENVTATTPGGPVPMRVYSPIAAGSEALPVLVYFHGGGWVIGNVDTHDWLARMFANDGGYRVISVDYRLSPEHKFPAAVDDAYGAVAWIEANATTLGIDPNRVAVGGDSAGGALAAVVAQLAKARSSPKIAFQMLLFPVTHIGSNTASLNDFAAGYFLERETLVWFYEHYLDESAEKSDPRISPLLAADLSGLPPAYIMLAGFDPLHDEGMEYAAKLRAAGVGVTVADYTDMVHCFVYMQAVLPQAREAVAAAAKAVRDGLAKA